jgi:hypothetical protein
MPRNLEPSQIALPYRIARGALVALPNPKAKNKTTFEILKFQFNPEAVTRARTGQWERKLDKKTSKAAQEKIAADAQRGGAIKSKSEVISFKLVFDATELRLREEQEPDGILPELAVLERFALGPDQMPDPPKKDNEFALVSLEPTEALLVLGPRSFPGVITQMNIVEQRFDVDLVPIRAEIDMRFRVLEATTVAVNKDTAKVFDDLIKQREALSAKAALSYEGDVRDAIARALRPPEGPDRQATDGLLLRGARSIVQGEVL